MSDQRKSAQQVEFIGRGLQSSWSRRALIAKGMTAGLALPAFALLAACNGDDDDVMDPIDQPDDDSLIDTADDSEDVGENGTPGGQIRIGVRSPVELMDPHLRFVAEDAMANLHIYSGLVRASVELEPMPELATSWETNDEGDEWTFDLRDDVTFQNGREFSSQDVADSFDRLLDPDTGSAFRVQVDMIEEVAAPDDTTAVFHLNRPYGGFAELLSNDFTSIVPIEEAETLVNEPIGTGAYRLGQQVTGERTVLVRNEDYWDTDNPPYLDEIHFIVMSEETTRMTALQGGEIDLLLDIAPPSVAIVEAAENVVYEEILTGTHLTIIMTYDEDPWSDDRVRTALKLSLDRDEVLQAAVQGFGSTAADHPVPPIDPMYPEVPIPEQDIDRARELLEEAGYPDGIDLVLHTSAGRVGMQEVALSVQDMSEAAGFRIEVQSHPIDAFWADYWAQVPFSVSNWNMRLPADQMLQVGYSTGAGWNETRWENPEFDELIRQAQATPDADDRRELIREACTILSEEGAVGIPIFRSGIDAWNRRVHNYRGHPMRWLDLLQVWVED